MSPTPPARRLRLGLPKRAFSQVLLMQLVIAAGVAVLVTGLFLAPLSKQLDQEAMHRAPSVTSATSNRPAASASPSSTATRDDRNTCTHGWHRSREAISAAVTNRSTHVVRR